jgi:hypothetical protein
VTDDSVTNLLKSFITGSSTEVMKPLHTLMDTIEGGKLRWVPFHMSAVLERFSGDTSLNPGLCRYLSAISEAFDSFKAANSSSRIAFENLFLIGLMIRISTGLLDETCDYFEGDTNLDYSFSYNRHWNLKSGQFWDKIANA